MGEFIQSEWVVIPIAPEETKEWILYKHYAHRMPSITYAFGLYRNNALQAVCTFGHPFAPTLIDNAFGGSYTDSFYELNRLCANEGLPRNALSFFVSSALKMLPKPCVVVSYADTSQNHHGYIYQATNWYYTGLSAAFRDYMVKGYEGQHSASILDKVGRSDGKEGHLDKVQLLKEKFGEENVYMVERPRKHRYFYLCGSKTERKEELSKLTYPILPYPKGDNVRYDASYEVKPIGLLF